MSGNVYITALVIPGDNFGIALLYLFSKERSSAEIILLYHPLQNHNMHEIIIFKSFRGLQLQLSGVVRIN